MRENWVDGLTPFGQGCDAVSRFHLERIPGFEGEKKEI